MKMSNITNKVVVITGGQQRHWGKHREASRRTRSKSCTWSAAFEPDSTQLVQEISASGGKAIGFATDVTKPRRSGSAHPRGLRRFRPRRCAPQ